MDIDTDPENGIDAGAVDDDDDDNSYGTRKRRKCRDKKVPSTTEEDEVKDHTTPSNLHPNDPGNFLKLCAALKILVSRRLITEEGLNEADELIRQYGLELIEVCLLMWAGVRHSDFPISFMDPMSSVPTTTMRLT